MIISLFAYVCGFGGSRKDLRYYIEQIWKKERVNKIHNTGIQDHHRNIFISIFFYLLSSSIIVIPNIVSSTQRDDSGLVALQ